MKYLMLVVVLVFAFSLGCGKPITIGTPIEKAKVDQLIPGTTPESKVVELFGQPMKTEQTAEGVKHIYSYYEESPRIIRKNIQKKTTLEVLTKGGVVQKYDLKREGIDSAN